MRILILTQWFHPEPNFKGLSFAIELQRRGHEVEVLTGFPNYPSGKVYEGYSIKPWQCDEIDGIRVNRVALYPSHNSSGLSRIANYMSFSIMTMLIGPLLIRNKPDVIYVYNLPTLSRTASFLRWLYGCKIIYDVQDLWPESVTSSGMLPMSRLLKDFLKNWCNKSYQRSDSITVLSPGFKKELVTRGVAEKTIEVIYNWTEENIENYDQLDNNLIQIMRPTEHQHRFNVTFAGNMGKMQGLETVLGAAETLLTEENNVHFYLIGTGTEKYGLKKKSRELGLSNVTFIPNQPRSAMGIIFKNSDVLLVHLKKDPLFKITIPSKTQAYLAAGKPIIMAVEGDATNLVQLANAGYSCKPDNPHALADCVRKLVTMSLEERNVLGENGRKFYERKMSFSHGVDRFESVFESVCEVKQQGN